MADTAGPRLLGFRVDAYLRDLGDFPRDAQLAWRNARTAGVLSEIRERTLNRLYRRRRFLILEHDLAALAPSAPPPGIEIRRFAGSDWSPLAEIVPGRLLRRFERHAAGGRLCFVAWRGNRPIGYGWLSLRVDPEFETYPLPLPPDAAYAADFYVVPQERRHGVGSALIAARLAHLRERGFAKVWRVVAHTNHASLGAWAKMAPMSSVVGESSFVKLLGRTQTRFHPRTDIIRGPA